MKHALLVLALLVVFLLPVGAAADGFVLPISQHRILVVGLVPTVYGTAGITYTVLVTAAQKLPGAAASWTYLRVPDYLGTLTVDYGNELCIARQDRQRQWHTYCPTVTVTVTR